MGFFYQPTATGDGFRIDDGFRGRSHYLAAGWSEYTGDLAPAQLHRVGDTLEPKPAPVPTEEWHETAIFADALDALLGSDEVKAAVAQNWKTTKFAIQVPPDRVNLLDPRIELFAAEIGLTVAGIRAKIEELENA